MIATRPLASLAVVAMLTHAAVGQTTTGADRYMRSAQSSLGRTNAMISSIAPNYVTPHAGGSAMIGATQRSIDRTNAAMRSMLANREATVRGLGQAATYRTSDNLSGVYWQRYYARRAMERSTYRQTIMFNPNGLPMTALQLAQHARLDAMAQEDRARRQAQMAARGAELARRFRRTAPTPPPSPGGFTPEMSQNGSTGADLLPPDVTITAPVPTPMLSRGRPHRD